MTRGFKVTVDELSRLCKKIFCPFITLAVPVLWVMLIHGYLKDQRNGAPPYTNKGEIAFMLIATVVGFLFSARYCYYELGWFQRNKNK